ncbi:LOW QUALITY PROTEIN: hypothetical protein PHPALM_31069 [Phytophthora palmivora]|uniref:Uncharacterized protein n=1 Tax=Phytophthora palmivora TaxID=4796 RepID=A0A2P4X3J2_9STRA|nr:LOW QUALITY PROTEIN: hypothetical protein PHPALM_31069 [Phytophthora palmivora]
MGTSTSATIEGPLVKAVAEARCHTAQNERGKSGRLETVNNYTWEISKGYNYGKRGHFKNECKAKKRLRGVSGGAAQGNNCSAETGFVCLSKIGAAGFSATFNREKCSAVQSWLLLVVKVV